MKTVPAPHHRLFVLLALLCFCAVLLSSGCATIANGRYQRVRVETDPPAAKVSVQGTRKLSKGVLQFETPGEVSLHRKEKHVVLRIEKDGYEPAEVALRRTLGAWAPAGGAGFLVLGVLTGRVPDGGGAVFGHVVGSVWLGVSVGIDLLTGSAYRLDPSKVSLTLQPTTGSSTQTDTPAHEDGLIAGEPVPPK